MFKKKTYIIALANKVSELNVWLDNYDAETCASEFIYNSKLQQFMDYNEALLSHGLVFRNGEIKKYSQR
jgi:hypothetical protein